MYKIKKSFVLQAVIGILLLNSSIASAQEEERQIVFEKGDAIYRELGIPGLNWAGHAGLYWEWDNATVTISTTLDSEKLDLRFLGPKDYVERYTFFLVRENGKWKVFYTTMAMSFEASRIPPEAIIKGKKKGE